MRPVRLEMKGFGAFREKTVVDFSDLELAAFVGVTGSGKSTIIDGITFALFGVVARYDDRRAVAPAINQMVPEARVSFEFEVDNKRYTAVRVARRNEKGASTKEARLEHASDVLAGRASEMDQAVEEVLGLDFDRFTKTVVLPQGRFAAFLHDKPSDLQELLRQLLDLVIYERMGAQARLRANAAGNQLEVLEPRLEAEVPSEEQIASLAAALESVTEAQAALQRSLAELAESDEAVAAANDHAEGLGVLTLAVAAVTVPKEALALGTELQKAQVSLEDAIECLMQASEEAREAEQAEKEGPNIEACRLLIARYGQLAELTETLSRLDEECKTVEVQHREATARASEIRERLDAREEAVEKASGAVDSAQEAADAGPDLAQLGRWRYQFDELERLRDQLEAANEALDVEKVREAAAREAFEEAQEIFRESAGILDRVRTVKQAEGLVSQLVEGEPCPVCRQVVNELPAHDHDSELEEIERVHREAEDAKHEHENALREAGAALAKANAAVDSFAGQQGELIDKLASAPNETKLDQQAALAEDLTAAVTQAQAALTAARQAETEIKERAETNEILETEREYERRLTSATARREACISQRAQVAEELAGQPDEATLENDIALAEQLAATCQRVQAAETEAKQTEQKERDAIEKLAEAELDARKEFAKCRDGFALLQPPTPQASLVQDWQELASWAAQLAAELTPELEHANERVIEEKNRHAEHVEAARAVCTPHFDPSDDPNRWQIEMATVVERANSDHEGACRQRRQMAELETQVEALRTEREVANELGRLLRSDGFEKWLLEEAVGDLMSRASERLLQLSNRQYSFSADSTDFSICDHHNADQVRPAKTLSGGETFLASLALALALSDSHAELAPEGAPGLESLFLDEGFGTLDPETLDVTAAAIEELGASGRMVGIVTHIRELAERMPIRFEVTKTPTTSTVARVTA